MDLEKLVYAIDTESDFDKKMTDKLLTDLSKVDLFKEFLKSSISKDLKRYFLAEAQDARMMIKGKLLGFTSLLTQIQNNNEAKELIVDMKKRHAKN